MPGLTKDTFIARMAGIAPGHILLRERLGGVWLWTVLSDGMTTALPTHGGLLDAKEPMWPSRSDDAHLMQSAVPVSLMGSLAPATLTNFHAKPPSPSCSWSTPCSAPRTSLPDRAGPNW